MPALRRAPVRATVRLRGRRVPRGGPAQLRVFAVREAADAEPGDAPGLCEGRRGSRRRRRRAPPRAASAASVGDSSATVSAPSTNLPIVPSVSFKLKSQYCQAASPTGTAPAVAKSAVQFGSSGVNTMLRNHLPATE